MTETPEPSVEARIDLHTHTTASDGSLTPTQLLEAAHESNLSALAITDHDTVDGLAEGRSAADRLAVEFVPGIELNCESDDYHVDILGYFIDAASSALTELLEKIREARVARAKQMVARLQRLGAPIEYSDVAALASGRIVARPHVAQALVACGFVPDVSTAFRSLIGRGGPAYADRYRLAPAQGCQLIRRAGGVPGLAHPIPPDRLRSDPLRLVELLPSLREAGLGALECYYPGYTPKVINRLEVLAAHFGLVPTGGSDYHGPWRPDRPLGCVSVPADTPAKLREQIAR